MYFALWIDLSIILTGEIYKIKLDSHQLVYILSAFVSFQVLIAYNVLYILKYKTFSALPDPIIRKINGEEEHKNQV